MSEDLIKKFAALDAENAGLKKQLEQNANNLDGMMSQLDATREQLNESLTISLNVRTNLIHIKKQYQKVSAELEIAQKKIASLEAKPAEVTPIKGAK